MSANPTSPQVEKRRMVAIRFAGDSGDGMQLTGSQFTHTSALAGNDLATLPDFPAEIRAPAGTLAGVSGFQIQFGSQEIFTPGDKPDVLVAMNPAALAANLTRMERGTMIFVNEDAFDDRASKKVGFDGGNPLDDDTLADYRVFRVPFTTLTRNALTDSPLSQRDKDRCKNFVALGLMYWVFNRDMQFTKDWIRAKFKNKADVAAANELALKTGYNYGITTDTFQTTFQVDKADIAPGLYRQITGNQASAYGFIAGANLAGKELFLGSYPITPASDILHELSKHKHFGVRTFQAEDEIAAVCAAIGAAFGGAVALTTTSGPGVALKGEAIGLAVITELPLVVASIQRGGPSTGLPTKTEQADLNMALFGRNGEAPMPIVAASTPGDCFHTAIEAIRLATKYMTPVFFLSDGYIANGAEPWKIPDVDSLPDLTVTHPTEANSPEGFLPYLRDDETLARPWAIPGTAGLEHRIGGLEKSKDYGNVSYDPANHEYMCKVRAEKVANIANDIPDAEVFGDQSGDVLLVGWGGTYGALHAATMHLRNQGRSVSHVHLRHLNPLPRNVETLLKSFKRVYCCELNLGQLRHYLRGEFLVDVRGINKMQGQPFGVRELVDRVASELDAMKAEGLL